MTQPQPDLGARWWRTALALTIGGMIYVFVTLFIVRGTAAMMTDRLVLSETIPSVLIGLFLGWSVVSFLTLIGLRFWQSWLRALATVMIWSTGYLITWILGYTTDGLSLPLFVGVWLVMGALGGLMFAVMPEAPAAQASRSQRSEFGRIPLATVDLLNAHVHVVTDVIIAVLPANRPIRLFTIRAVLNHTLRDWYANGNFNGLDASDIDDLRSFVQVAMRLAGNLNSPVGQAIYRATLTALLADWLEHWNADGVMGPPRWRTYRNS